MLYNNRMQFEKQESPDLQCSKCIYLDLLLLGIYCCRATYFRLAEMIHNIHCCQRYLSLERHMCIINPNNSRVLMKQAKYCEPKQISKETGTDLYFYRTSSSYTKSWNRCDETVQVLHSDKWISKSIYTITSGWFLPLRLFKWNILGKWIPARSQFFKVMGFKWYFLDD